MCDLWRGNAWLDAEAAKYSGSAQTACCKPLLVKAQYVCVALCTGRVSDLVKHINQIPELGTQLGEYWCPCPGSD